MINKFSEIRIRNYCLIMRIGVIIGLVCLVVGILGGISKAGFIIRDNRVMDIKKFLRSGEDFIFYISHISAIIFLILPVIGVGYLAISARREGMVLYFYLGMSLVIYIIVGIVIVLVR